LVKARLRIQLAFDRRASCALTDQIEGNVPDDGHVGCVVAFVQVRQIILKDDIKGPVERVLDDPMAAGGMRRWPVAQGASTA
jgi:hypothetical protein